MLDRIPKRFYEQGTLRKRKKLWEIHANLLNLIGLLPKSAVESRMSATYCVFQLESGMTRVL